MPAATPLPRQVTRRSKPGRRRSPYRRPPGRPPTHGGFLLTRVLRTVPLDTIDRRSQAGVYLRHVREDLLGQLRNPSPAERLIAEEAAKASLITRAVGEWLLAQETLVRTGGDLLPAVLQHAALQGGLLRLLTAIGLRNEPRRHSDDADDLASYVKRKDQERPRAGG
jgi:hypothetical protein